jgi:hypothetical protein
MLNNPMLAALVGLALVAGSAPAGARMEPGDLRLGAGLGLRSTEAGVMFAAGASFGVFVVHGLEPGIDFAFQTGADSPTLLALSGSLRWVMLPELSLSPYLRAGGGRLFLVDFEDAWMATAGAGLVYWIGPWYGLDVGADYRWYFFPDETIGGFDIRFGLIFLIGTQA